MKKILCPKCHGAYMEPGWTFSVLECPKCKHRIEKGGIMEKILCPKCHGAYMGPGWTFSILVCPKCKHRIDKGE